MRDSTEHTEHSTAERSPTLETGEVRDQHSHVKVSGTSQPSEEQAAITKPLEQFWIRKNDDDDETDDTSLPTISHGISLTRMNYKSSISGGILSNDPKNRDFIAFLGKDDSLVEDHIHDIEKLYSKISYKLWINQYLGNKEEYKQSIKEYIACRKKYYRQNEIDEEQKRLIAKKARESLDTLRECLLDMHFARFAETEQGSEIASLEEKAKNIYQAATDEVRESIDRRKNLYASFLSIRNTFLPHWNIPEDDAEEEEYTEQELHALDRMKESVQKYLALCRQEVKKCYERSLKDEDLLNMLTELLAQKDHQEGALSFPSGDIKDLKSLLRDVKSLHKSMQEEISNDPEFQEAYDEKCQEYTRLIDHVRKTAISKRGHDQSKDDTGAQEQAQPPDTLEHEDSAQDISDIASEALFQLMDIREMLLEKCFEGFAETEYGQDVARLEEQAREAYWAVTDRVREQADQANEYYADFLTHRNAFLRKWNRSKGESKPETYTEQQISSIDKMKESLHQYIEFYQQEMEKSYEPLLEGEALHERLLSSLSAEEQQEIRRLLQSHGLKNLPRLLEDVRDLHNNIYKEQYNNFDIQPDNTDFQEDYNEKCYECIDLINQFKASGISEKASEVIIHMIDMRHFLLMKASETFFVRTEAGKEMASLEEQALNVSQRQSAQAKTREESHQQLALEEYGASMVEEHFAAFLKQEEGKHINSCLEEISMYLKHNNYLKNMVEKELYKFENKKKEIFSNYDKFLANTKYFKERQMKELHNYLFTAKIKIEERIYTLFLHHGAGQQTKQLEENYRALAATIDFLFERIPLDLQNTLRTPAKAYYSAKADLVKQLVCQERSASRVKKCAEELNRSLAEQITSMKEEVWSQFRILWHETDIKREIMDFLLEQGEYEQGELESYIENILRLSREIADELYQHDIFREALKIQFAYNLQRYIDNEYRDRENQQLHDSQSVYEHLILLHDLVVKQTAGEVSMARIG